MTSGFQEAVKCHFYVFWRFLSYIDIVGWINGTHTRLFGKKSVTYCIHIEVMRCTSLCIHRHFPGLHILINAHTITCTEGKRAEWPCFVSYLDMSFRILSGHVISYLIWTCHFVSYLDMSFRILSGHVISYLIWTCHFVSYLDMSFRILSGHVISYLIWTGQTKKLSPTILKVGYTHNHRVHINP